jgi:hypothetical protein
MPKGNQIIINAWNCYNTRFSNHDSFKTFLNKVASESFSKVLDGPKVISIDGTDLCASIVTSNFNLTLHGFKSSKEIVVDIHSYANIDHNKVVSQLINHFNLDLRSVKITPVTSTSGEVMECEEAGCTRRASSSWHGLKVCRDHYEWYKARHENRLKEMDDIS